MAGNHFYSHDCLASTDSLRKHYLPLEFFFIRALCHMHFTHNLANANLAFTPQGGFTICVSAELSIDLSLFSFTLYLILSACF